MLLILSDLHLADTVDKSTINVADLCATIEGCAELAEGLPDRTLHVLLLGDIFEILKSQVWIEREMRPWHLPAGASTRDQTDTVTAIFKGIEKSNQAFFDRWSDMKRRHPDVQAIYVPGNHDWPLNHPAGIEARSRLVELLHLDRDPSESFPLSFLDWDYRVLATHGHEYDIFNRTEHGKVAFGDAVILEILLRLPALVADKLGLSAADPRLAFLHELDNVRPQSGAAMGSWLLYGAARLEQEIVGARSAVADAVTDTIANMRSLRRSRHTTGAWQRGDKWISALTAGVGAVARWGWVLPFVGRQNPGTESDSYLHAAEKALASLDAVDLQGTGKSLDFYVCGHTHIPEHVAVGQRTLEGALGAPMFLNTGTWRRVQRYVKIRGGKPTFVTYDEECFVVIHSQREQRAGRPSYEFKRTARRYLQGI